MLTIFSIPKPFTGHIGVIQRNAIASWARLASPCEIILFGSEEGTEEAAGRFHAVHAPEVARNEFGTPLLNSVFAQAGRMARHLLLCYVNADIILTSGFLDAIRRVGFPNFLGAGRRWDLDIAEELRFDTRDAEEALLARARQNGSLHAETGIDYFVFPRDSGLLELPPFAVGRPGWDNWFIYRARALGLPFVDLTGAALVIHQNHGYAHVPRQRGEFYEGPEADRNRELMGGWERAFSLLDATHVATPRGVRPALGLKRLRRRWHTLPVLHPGVGKVTAAIRSGKCAVAKLFGNSEDSGR